MGNLRVHLFGKLNVQCGSGVLAGLDNHKTEELFCYLLLHRGQQHHREALADLFSSQCSAAQAKKALRQFIWRLQSRFGTSGELEQQPLLLVDRDWVQINPQCDLWLDVDVLERAFALVEDRPGEGLSAEQAEVARRAVDLYQCDLLMGWYEDWCLYERERLQHMCLLLLDKVMGYCEVHQQYDSGLLYGEQVLRYDRANEHTYQRMMRMCYLAGSRSAALHEYELCAAALRKELDVKPSKQTTTLFDQIRKDQLAILTAPTPASDLQSQSPGESLARLQQVEATLNEIHTKVRSDISALQCALGIRA